MGKVGIHQPNYLPWAGYFKKISEVDKFIFFDTVPAARHKSYTVRAKILPNNGERWLTIPIPSSYSGHLIRDVLFQSDYWLNKHIGSLTCGYKRSNERDFICDLLQHAYQCSEGSLSKLNQKLIIEIAQFLGIRNTFFYEASELCDSDDSAPQQIVALVKSVQGKCYITGRGAGSDRYLSEVKDLMPATEILFVPELPPEGDFGVGASIVDALLKKGISFTQDLLQ